MVHRESDRCIVPLKLDNSSSRMKPGRPRGCPAVQGRPTNRRSVPELSREQVVPPTALSGESLVLSRLERITNRAEQHPEEAFIIATKKVNWISDADIKGFFDNVNHEQLVELLRTRIGDPRMLQLIERFLKAGVMIEGRRHETEDGVPPTHFQCVPGGAFSLTCQRLFALHLGPVVRA